MARKTNLYTGGVHQPLLVASPAHPASHGIGFDQQVSLLDIVPTALDWLAIPYPHYSIFRSAGEVVLTGSSLLHHLDDQKSEMAGQNLLRGKSIHQLAENPTSDDSKLVFGSHVLHEATMYYPMRSLRSDRCLRGRLPKAATEILKSKNSFHAHFLSKNDYFSSR